MSIPEAAVMAAKPWAENFLRRRGYEPRGREAEILVRYILEAAALHIETHEAVPTGAASVVLGES